MAETTADTSETGIANRALSLAECSSTLTNINEPNRKAARVCRLHLPNARDFVLRRYAFAFSQFQATLQPLTDAPIGGSFSGAYAQPEDSLRIIRVHGFTKRQWRALGRARLLISATDAITVDYVRQVTNLGEWDALALELLVHQLAKLIQPELTHHRGISGELRTKFAELDDIVPKIDAIEQDSEQDDYDDDHWTPGYIAARR